MEVSDRSQPSRFPLRTLLPVPGEGFAVTEGADQWPQESTAPPQGWLCTKTIALSESYFQRAPPFPAEPWALFQSLKCEGKTWSWGTVFPQPQRSPALPAWAEGLGGKHGTFSCGSCHVSDQRCTLTFPAGSQPLRLFIQCLVLRPPAPQAGCSSSQQAQGGKCEHLGMTFKIGKAF